MDFILKNIDNSYEHIANSLLIYLYEYVNRYYDEYKNQELEGKIEVLRGYQSMIDYLQEKFPKLYILISRNTYLEFEDELCKQYIANELGDGLGIIESDVNTLTRYDINDTLRIPNGVKKFNELKYFTALTNLNGTKTGGSFDVFRLSAYTLEEINLRNVTYLGSFTFDGLQNLKKLNETQNINSMGNNVFRNCTSLEEVEFLNINGNVDFKVFYGCTSLINAHIDGLITFIPSNMFQGCTNLQSVTGFTNVTETRQDAFVDCVNLIELDIPFENLTKITFSTFRNCQSLDLSDKDFTNVVDFGNNCFQQCYELKTFNFGTTNAIKIGADIFYKCSKLQSIIIPNNVTTSISYYGEMFNGCTNLTSITLPTNQSEYNIPQNFCYLCSSLENIDISNAINIKQSAFNKCSSLETVTTGSNLNKIEAWVFGDNTLLKNIDLSNCIDIGQGAFYNCTSLQTINLSNCTMLGIETFKGCTSINNIIGGNNVTNIGRGCFHNLGNNENLLNKISFPSLTILRDMLFAYSNGITEIEFSENLASIEGTQQFRNCPNLKKVTGLTALNTLSANMFLGCTLLEEVELSENITILPDSIFESCKSLKTLIFPNVVTLQNECFYNTNIETLSLPSLTETPNNNAFSGCKIKHLSIPNVTNIIKDHFRDNNIETLDVSSLVSGPRYMFYGNTKLTEVSLPSMVTIPQDGFRNCTALTTVNITSTTTTIGQSAFNSCSSLKNIDISHVTNIKGWAFENNTSLKSIDLSSCTELLEGAFKGCVGLNTDITIPPTIINLSKEVFYNCQNIKSLYLSANQIVSIGQSSLYMGSYPIYVPDALVNDYKSASGWTSFSSRIKSINEKP